MKIRRLENLNLSFGSTYNKKNFEVGATYRQFDSDYGIPPGEHGHLDGANVQYRRKTIKLEGNFYSKKILNSENRKPTVNIKYNTTYFNQKEFESEKTLGAEFVKRNHTGRIEYNHSALSFLNEGIVGTELDFRTLENGW